MSLFDRFGKKPHCSIGSVVELIRFGGHLPSTGYDVPSDDRHP